jgi:hypothetical protein
MMMPLVRGENAPELLRIEGPLGRAELDVDGTRPGEDGVRPVVFVPGLEHDDLLAGIYRGEQRAQHRLGRAAADRDLALRIDGLPGEALVLRGERVAQRLRSPGDRVLVLVGEERLGGALLERLRRRKVRETLRQVHGAVTLREPRHLADHRLAELLGFGRDLRF